MSRSGKLCVGLVCVLGLGALLVLNWRAQRLSLPIDSQREALVLAKREMRSNRIPGHSPTGRLLAQPLRPGSQVGVRLSQQTPTVTKRACWFAYVDDMPEYDLSHTFRALYIDVETGSIRVERDDMFPQFRGVDPQGKPIKAAWVRF